MKKAFDKADFLVSRAAEDVDFRERLLANAEETIEKEFGVRLPADHEIHVHEETYSSTHVVLPPRSKLSEAERKAARTGAASLEFLRKTLSDPAPPVRAPALERARVPKTASTLEALARQGSLALHPVQHRQPGDSTAFRKTSFRFGPLCACPGKLR